MDFCLGYRPNYYKFGTMFVAQRGRLKKSGPKRPGGEAGYGEMGGPITGVLVSTLTPLARRAYQGLCGKRGYSHTPQEGGKSGVSSTNTGDRGKNSCYFWCPMGRNRKKGVGVITGRPLKRYTKWAPNGEPA